MADLKLSEAKVIIDKAFQEAAALKMKPIAGAVLGAGATSKLVNAKTEPV